MFIMSKFTVKAANADAEAVIEEFLDALEAMSMERFLKVWHDDGVQIMPYAPEGFPARLEGKEAIRQQYGSLPKDYKSILQQHLCLPVHPVRRTDYRIQGILQSNHFFECVR